MKKLLITGASGFLGNEIAHLAQKQFRLFAQTNRNNVSFDCEKQFQVDFLTANFDALSSESYNYIIHAAAISSSVICEQETEKAYRLNVEISKQIVDYCSTRSCKLLFCSSDMVFDGTKGNYVEEDVPHPVLTYSKHKFFIENYIQENLQDYIIARLSLIIGKNGGYFKHFMRSINQNEAVNLFIDEIRSPIHINSAAQACLHLLIQENGIFHLAGNQSMNRYELGELLLQQTAPEKKHLLQATTQNSFQHKRPKNCGMSNAKLVKSGLILPDLSESLQINT